MGIIRLRVEILKWNEGNVPKDVCPPRDETILSWMEPCPAEMPIRDLMGRITARFEEIHVGKGKLGMKWLRDGYGDVLTSTLTIGDCFTDRSDRSKGPVDPKDWTVQVDRTKPNYHDLQNPLRFASLAPESSARPQNRLVNPTLQQAVAGRRPLHYVQSGQQTSYLGRRPDATAEDARNDPDRPILSSERDLANPTQQPQLPKQGDNDRYVVADSQPSPEHRGASYGPPHNLPISSLKGGLPVNSSSQIDISDSPVRNPGSRDEEGLSPKIEVSETELLINQIPTSNAEPVPDPIHQTPIGPDGFRKPALPQKGKINSSRSPNTSAETILPRHAPLKRPNQNLGRQGLLDPVETDIESSQELPPLKRPKLATPRRNILAEPRSFNSINQEAQNMTMRDVMSPEVAEEPLRGWPSRNGQDSESQVNHLLQHAATAKLQTENKRKWQLPSKLIHDAQGESPAIGDANALNASRLVRDEPSNLVATDLRQSHKPIEQNGQAPASGAQNERSSYRAVNGEREDGEQDCDTFDIPSSPSPDLPASAQASRKSSLHTLVPGYGSKDQLEGAGLDRPKDQESPGKIRGRRLTKTSPNGDSPQIQSVNGTTSDSVQKRRRTSDLVTSPGNATNRDRIQLAPWVPGASTYNTPTRNTLARMKSREELRSQAETSAKDSARTAEKEMIDLERRREPAKETESERINKRQQKSIGTTSPKSTREEISMKPVLPSNDVKGPTTRTRLHLDNINPAKKMNLEATGHKPSILRSSSSQERRSGTSVSFADAKKGSAMTTDPTATHNNSLLQSVNLSKNRRLNENHPTDSEISERIKGGFRGTWKGNESSAGKLSAASNLAKGKERTQERRESTSSAPEVAKAIVSEASEDDEGWETYTIDGNIGPSRIPRINTLQPRNASKDLVMSEPNPPASTRQNAAESAERAQSVSSGKSESTGESSGPSSPRSPAKEVKSSASGSSVEGSVHRDESESGSEEESDLERSDEANSVPEEAQQAVLKASTSKSSTLNGPNFARRSTNMALESKGSKTNGFMETAQEVSTSEEESEDHVEEDEAADLQLQSENRRSLELGSSQRRPDSVEKPPEAKEPSLSAPRPINGKANQTKGRTSNAKPLASTILPRASNGRFVGVSALNAKSKNTSSQKPPSSSARPFQSSGLSLAKAIQIDTPDDSDDSSSDDSEIEIKADSKTRQSRNKALEGLHSVQNLFANGKTRK